MHAGRAMIVFNTIWPDPVYVCDMGVKVDFLLRFMGCYFGASLSHRRGDRSFVSFWRLLSAGPEFLVFTPLQDDSFPEIMHVHSLQILFCYVTIVAVAFSLLAKYRVDLI